MNADRRLILLVAMLFSSMAAVAVARAQRASAPATGTTSLEIVAGTRASYLVQEQLLGFDLPNDAVGTTTSVSGGLLLAADGSVRQGSKISVDLRTLKSDSDRRDGYVRDRTLQAAQYPTADFVPRRVQGLTLPLPASGKASFQLLGDMTIHGVTSELAWDIDAAFTPDRVTGQAKTSFPFAKFNLTIPRLRALLSVEDKIRLELDLVLRRTVGE